MCRENPRRSGILLEEICQEDQRVCPLYGHFAPPGGVLRVSSDRDDRMRAKIKTPKNLKGPKIPGPKFNPSKPPSLNFRAMKIYSQNYAAGICWNCQITNLHIVLNIPKNSYLIKLPKKVPAKISNPQKSWNWKFQTQKNPFIILVTWNPEYPPTPPPFLGLHPSHFAPVLSTLSNL